MKQQITHVVELLKKPKKQRLLLAAVFSILMIGLFDSTVIASSVAMGFKNSDNDLTTGMAASFSDDLNAQTVVRASSANILKFVGIVTTKNANLVTLTNNTATVVVTTSGQAEAFVTDLNGIIKKGDNLTVSPIKGFLMKASNVDTSFVGSALQDSVGQPATKQSVESNDGKNREVSATIIQININPRNIAGGSNKNKSFISVLGKNLAGKDVSDWQTVLAFIVFVLLIVVEGSLIYGSVHSSMMALGRNPMAHDAVYKQLAQVILAVLAVLAFGIATIYTVLQI